MINLKIQKNGISHVVFYDRDLGTTVTVYYIGGHKELMSISVAPDVVRRAVGRYLWGSL
jgi:hypothetical protein